jgi:sulfite reductase (ferredoxin)
MKSFRTETENILNPIVEQDILELGQKIHEYKTGEFPEDKFKALRLARGVYGQRQLGVQMIRIKLPYGKVLHNQLVRMADVSDEYSNGNLHLTTRQDVQIHYVSLDRTPELWKELEQDEITLREACGNTVRNITASPFAGVDPDEPFDVSPYAQALYEYLLRNPVNQDMGRKIKISFSSSEKDTAYSFLHDLGFIPKIEDGKKGFKLLIGGGLGVKPFLAKVAKEFIPADEIFAYSTAVLRVFDRYGERQKRNKARLKYLIDSLGVEELLRLVNEELLVVEKTAIQISEVVDPQKSDVRVAPITNVEDVESYLAWLKTNVYTQKQEGFYTLKLKITNGDISSKIARKLAKLVNNFSNGELRVTINQGLIIKFVRKDSLPYVYESLKELGLSAPGFDSVADITSCPGTDTCNLGIANSTGLARELEGFIQEKHGGLIYNSDIKIKISGCFNACGQHSIANIGFHGSTIKVDGKVAPAVQLLLGGGVIGNGEGIISEKIIKLPTKRAILGVDIILTDYKEKGQGLFFNEYFTKQGNHYFYDLLKDLAAQPLKDTEFLDWGQDEDFAMSVGVGECAGVVIDLAQTVQYEVEERIDLSKETLELGRYSDSIYHSYNVFVHSAKLLLLSKGLKYNSQHSIITEATEILTNANVGLDKSFREMVLDMKKQTPSKEFANQYNTNAIEFNKIIKELIKKPSEFREEESLLV